MTFLLAALLAGQPITQAIDVRSLDLQARAEAMHGRQPVTRPRVRRASATASLDLASITTICRAAGGQSDPAGFINTLVRAYSMGATESATLRSSCAAYLAGQADASRRLR